MAHPGRDCCSLPKNGPPSALTLCNHCLDFRTPNFSAIPAQSSIAQRGQQRHQIGDVYDGNGTDDIIARLGLQDHIIHHSMWSAF